MKKTLTILFAASMFLNVNCGTEGDCPDQNCGGNGGQNNNGGTDDGTDDGDQQTPADNLAPLRSPSAGVLEFSVAYIEGTNCAEVRGDLPGMTWSDGVDLGSEHDGYRGISLSLAAGTYELSYVGWANCSSHGTDVWADYGTKENLVAMNADARGFVNCNWWNGSHVSHPSNPSCDLRIRVDSSGRVTAAGNMASYNGE